MKFNGKISHFKQNKQYKIPNNTCNVYFKISIQKTIKYF